MDKRTVYIISGPTAVGKSLIAYYLAKRVNGEIVNCDSVQLYKYMDIGSAKPDEREMAAVKHHLYSIADPRENMTVAAYQKLAIETINDLLSRGRTPIVCGGTGLYLNSILYDMDFGATAESDERRVELERLCEERGSEYMYQYLEALDPDAASRIHPNNARKIVRAIEAFEYGRGIRDLSECPLNPDYDFKFFALNMEREWLYDRINRRVSRLISDGLVDEVNGLLEQGYDPDLPSMKGIGYKEIIGFLNGEYDLFDAKELIMKNTRHYAKRQITWLKRYDFVNWINIEKGETVGEIVDRILEISQSTSVPNN
ncbi:MAG: tRNA (adenosine(37)-N6)-dimethylallyltransferase MiaA [Clostridiales bacterium]|jgi:tRNA dimethylallyltransferase|nr:tRNA (adenosine(37)-N6)-dimethylallyltransferase MiaA [Clostridiales bacterium]